MTNTTANNPNDIPTSAAPSDDKGSDWDTESESEVDSEVESEVESDTPAEAPTCTKCPKSEGLKRCAKCQTTPYCSRECQKADWKAHKKVCATNAAAAASASTSAHTPSNATSSNADKPFHRLKSRTWLHDRPQKETYKLLIDAYRFRMEDDYTLDGDVDMDSIYGGMATGIVGFKRFLGLATKRRGLLPPWWDAKKATACVDAGMKGGRKALLACAIEKSDVMEEYKNPLMPMQLRMIAEQVYKRGPGGQSGAAMLEVQMMSENREVSLVTMDNRSMFGR